MLQRRVEATLRHVVHMIKVCFRRVRGKKSTHTRLISDGDLSLAEGLSTVKLSAVFERVVCMGDDEARKCSVVFGDSALAAVQLILEDLAGLEGEDVALRDGDLAARLGVATGAGFFVAHNEVAKAADLEHFAFGEDILDGFEDFFDNFGSFALADAANLIVNRVNNVRFCHG